MKLYKNNLNNFKINHIKNKENKNILNGKNIYNQTMNNLNNNSNKNILENIKESLDLQNKKSKEFVDYNNEKQINKSNSYFIDNIYKNSNYFLDLNNSNENPISSKNNVDQSNNYKENINIFNKKNTNFNFLIPKKKNSFKPIIYSDLKLDDIKYSDNDSSDSNSYESLDINELINKVNYLGDKKDFPKYIEELKLKADITTMVQNMFKNEINGYDGLSKFFENYSKNKSKKILDMYKYLIIRLLQENQNIVNDKEINLFFEEIYSK